MWRPGRVAPTRPALRVATLTLANEESLAHLRKKLAEATGGDNYIETVWGRGYVLRENAPPMGDIDLRETA